MSFYSATGELISNENPSVCNPQVKEVKEVIEYKANGNLVIEKDEKELVTHATKLPSQPVYNSDSLGVRRGYFQDEE